MNKQCGWKEEQVIDYLLGELPVWKEKELQVHLTDCDACQKTLDGWQYILKDKAVSKKPSPFLKERIDKSIDESLSPKKKKMSAKQTISLLASAAMLFLVFGLFQLPLTSEDSYVVKQNDEIEENNALLNNPQTVQFHVIPVSGFDAVNGSVWVNDNTNELLMDVEGLKPLDKNDYQVWLVESNSHLHDELLDANYGKSQLYYKGTGVNQIQLIRVSIEPKGGSQSPTGPDTFMVDLER